MQPVFRRIRALSTICFAANSYRLGTEDSHLNPKPYRLRRGDQLPGRRTPSPQGSGVDPKQDYSSDRHQQKWEVTNELSVGDLSRCKFTRHSDAVKLRCVFLHRHFICTCINDKNVQPCRTWELPKIGDPNIVP